jgi:flagella basal body P-ring formation protein FlgA
MIIRVLWCLVLASMANTCCAKDLILKPRALIASPFVRLSQLVVDTQTAKLYESVFLGSTPKKDGSRAITLSYIQDRLRRKGFITVTPKTNDGSSRVIIKALNVSAPITSSIGMTPPKLPISARDSIIPKKNQTKFQYLKTKSFLKRGTLLSPEMVDISPEHRFIEGGFINPEDLIGYQLERSLRQGTIIHRDHTSIPPTIAKNTTIKVIFKLPGIEISGIAKSIGEGKIGDIIEVRRSGEILSGTIIDPHTVLIQ